MADCKIDPFDEGGLDESKKLDGLEFSDEDFTFIPQHSGDGVDQFATVFVFDELTIEELIINLPVVQVTPRHLKKSRFPRSFLFAPCARIKPFCPVLTLWYTGPMVTLLLQTKLYIPPSRLKLVSRSRLLDRLNSGLNRQLTLICAPAGFGKTTLLSEWAALKDEDFPLLSWFSLEENDNNLSRFLTYLIAALQTVQPDVGKTTVAMLQSP